MAETPSDPTEALLRSYSAGGGINYLDAAATLPSRPAIDAACVELLSLLFPGFHGEPVVRPGRSARPHPQSHSRSARAFASRNVQEPRPARRKWCHRTRGRSHPGGLLFQARRSARDALDRSRRRLRRRSGRDELRGNHPRLSLPRGDRHSAHGPHSLPGRTCRSSRA